MANITVLVVEDDLHTRNIIEVVLKRDRLLRYQEIDVVCAADGEEGLRLFREQTPTLVITDLLMPKLDGFELIKAIRNDAAGKELPILATSAIVRDKAVLSRLESEFSIHLQLKPFSPRVLATQIWRLLGVNTETSRPASAAKRTKESTKHAAPPRSAVSPAIAETVPKRRTDDQRGAGSNSERIAAEPTKAAPPEITGFTVNASEPYELTEHPLAGVLLDAFEQQWTGALTVKRRQSQKKIYLLSGHPIFVRSNLRDETLGQLLIRSGRISEQQHRDVLKTAQQRNIKYGEALAHLRVMTEFDILRELVSQTRYKVLRCLQWRSGRWQFTNIPDIGVKVPRCTIDPVSTVFAGLRTRPSIEDTMPRLLSGNSAGIEVVPQPRLAQYRDRFVEVFGGALIAMLDGPCRVEKVVRTLAIQEAAVQIDALLQANMVVLKDGDVVRNSAAFLRTPSETELSTVGEIDSPVPDMIALDRLSISSGGPAKPRPAERRHSIPLRDSIMSIEADLQVKPEKNVPPRVQLARQLIEATYLGLHEKNHYEVLGVIPETDTNGIEAAYRIKRSQFDLARFRGLDLGDSYGRLEEICAALDTAYLVLINPDRRKEYALTIQRDRSQERERAMGAETHYQRGCEMMRQGNFAEAMVAFRDAARLDEQPEYVAQEALAHFRMNGESELAGQEAMLRVQAAQAVDSQQPGPHLVAALICESAGALAEAISHLRDTLKVDPRNEKALAELERVFLQRDDHQCLEREYRRVIFLLGKSDQRYAAQIWKRLAFLYKTMGEREKAYTAGETALRMNSGDGELRLWMAELDREDPLRSASAIERYRDQLQQEPGNSDVLRELFLLFCQTEQWDAAFLAASAKLLQGKADADEIRMLHERRNHGAMWLTRPLGRRCIESIKHADDDPRVAELLRILHPTILKFGPVHVERYGVRLDRKGKLEKRFKEVLTSICAKIGVPYPQVTLCCGGQDMLTAVATEPPMLLLDQELAKEADENEICFRLAEAAWLVSGISVVGLGHSMELIHDAITAVVGLVIPEAYPLDLNPRCVRIQKQLAGEKQTLTSAKSILELASKDGDSIDLDQWLEGTRQTAERVALLVCGDLITGGRVVGERSMRAMNELVRFALGKTHLQCRNQLSGAAEGAH